MMNRIFFGLVLSLIALWLVACTSSYHYVYDLHSPHLRGVVHVLNRGDGRWALLYSEEGEDFLIEGAPSIGSMTVYFVLPARAYRAELVLMLLPVLDTGYERKTKNGLEGPYFELVLVSHVPAEARPPPKKS